MEAAAGLPQGMPDMGMGMPGMGAPTMPSFDPSTASLMPLATPDGGSLPPLGLTPDGSLPPLDMSAMAGTMPSLGMTMPMGDLSSTVPGLDASQLGAAGLAGLGTAGFSTAGLPSLPTAGGTMSGPYLDATSGRYYYFDPVTQQSTWATDPAALAAAAANPATASLLSSYAMMPQLAAYYAMMGQSLGGVGLTTATAGTGDSQNECGDFKRGKCDRGDTCKYVHVRPSQECRDYKQGRCTRGGQCKFLHNGEVAHEAASRPQQVGQVMAPGARARSRSR